MLRRTASLALVGLALVAGLVALAPTAAAQDTTITVTAHDYHFTTDRTGSTQNPDIQLEPGSTVEVTLGNEGDVRHNLHIMGPVDKTSPDVAPGETVTFTFTVPEDAPASFTYRCDYHQGPMNGDVVTGSSSDGGGSENASTDGGGNGTPGPGVAATLLAVGAAAARRRR